MVYSDFNIIHLLMELEEVSIYEIKLLCRCLMELEMAWARRIIEINRSNTVTRRQSICLPVSVRRTFAKFHSAHLGQYKRFYHHCVGYFLICIPNCIVLNPIFQLFAAAASSTFVRQFNYVCEWKWNRWAFLIKHCIRGWVWLGGQATRTWHKYANVSNYFAGTLLSSRLRSQFQCRQQTYAY